MKKTVLLLCVFVLLTGCGSTKNKKSTETKTITCSLKQIDNDFTSISEVEVNFSNNSIDNYTTSTNIEVPDEYTNLMDTLLNQAKEPFLEYENLSGITIDSKSDKDSIYVALTVDSSKVEEKDLEKVNELLDLSSDYNTIKNSFEALDYECK